MKPNELLDIASLPEWYKDNYYIKNGYRPPKPSFMYCLKSILSIHSESGNIWTHLMGSVLFIILWFYALNCNSYKKFGLMDKLVFSGFFCGIIICLLTSASFHTFNCHSKPVFKIFAKLDYCGISLLITVSFIPWIYYGFYYSLIPRIIYLSLTALLGILCIIISIFDKFSNPEYRRVRGILFISNGLSGVIPVLHWVVSHQYYTLNESAYGTAVKSIILLALMGSIYIFGALFYMSKIPERLYPGKFDIWLNSHQIFHVMVIIAGVTYYHSMTLIADTRLNQDLPFFEVVKDHKN